MQRLGKMVSQNGAIGVSPNGNSFVEWRRRPSMLLR
jgi:hypothetical protein